MTGYPFSAQELSRLIDASTDEYIRRYVTERLEQQVLARVDAILAEREKQNAKGAAAMAKLFDALRDVAGALKEPAP